MSQHLAHQELLAVKDDINSDIGTIAGQTNRGYASKIPSEYFAGNHIMEGSMITVPRDEGAQPMRNSAV